MIPDLKACDAFADFNHNARALMSEDRRKDAFWVIAGARELVRVAQAGGFDFNQNLTRFRAFKIDLHDLKRLTCSNSNGGTGSHHGLSFDFMYRLIVI